MNPLRDDLLEALKSGPLSARQASEAVGTSYQCALKVLAELQDRGEVFRRGWVKTGRYSAACFHLTEKTP